MHHALDDEHIHAHRRVNQAQLDGHDDDDAEPNRIKAELHDDGEDDGHGQDDHGHGIHQATQDQVHHHDQCQDAIAAQTQIRQESRQVLRHLGHGQKVAKDQGADQHGEDGGGGAGGRQQGCERACAVKFAAQHAQ